jgi:hypothetical protein
VRIGTTPQQHHLGVTERRYIVRSDQRHPVARGEAPAVASVQVGGTGPHADAIHQVRRSSVVHADIGALHTRAEVATHVVARLAATHHTAARTIVGAGGDVSGAHQAAGAWEARVVRLHARIVLREDTIAATQLTPIRGEHGSRNVTIIEPNGVVVAAVHAEVCPVPTMTSPRAVRLRKSLMG